MTPPIRPERSPAEYLQFLRQSDPEKAKAFEAFLTDRGQAHHIGIADRQMAFRSGDLQRQNEAATFAERQDSPYDLPREQLPTSLKVLGDVQNVAQSALGTAATVGRGVPGGHLAQVGFGQMTGESPEAVREAIEANTNELGLASGLGRMVGAGATLPAAAARVAGAGARMVPQGASRLAQALWRSDAAMIPRTLAGSGLVQAAGTGAGYGALDAALTGEDVTAEERLAGIGPSAATGAAVGPLVQMGANVAFAGRDLARALSGPSRGAIEKRLIAERSAAADPLYTQARAEGRQWQGPIRAPGDRDIVPYMDEAVNRPSFREDFPNPTPFDVLDRTRGEVVDQAFASQGQKATQATTGQQRVRAATRADANDARILRERLDDELGQMTPAYAEANQAFAEGSGNIKAAQDASNAMKGLVKGEWVADKRLRTRSPEAFESAIPTPGVPAGRGQFTPPQAEAAREGAYAGLRESMIRPFANTEGGWNPLKLFGLGPDAARALSAGRFLRPLDEAVAGKPLPRPKTLRDALLAAGYGATP